MNPVDYETEEYQKEQDALEQNQSAPRSRQIDGFETVGSKRKFSPGGDVGTKRALPRQRTGDVPALFSILLHSSIA